MPKTPKDFDFQKSTATHIVKLFNKGQKHILLADEVGLGKTVVAKRVIYSLAKKNKGKTFKVVYICSNASIANQNVQTLGDDADILKVSESRLSMQHLHIYQKKCKKNIQLLPLTPSTSFFMDSNKCGNVDERALIFCLLKQLFQQDGKKSSHQNDKKLMNFMRGNVNIEDNWENKINKYQNLISKKKTSYIAHINNSLRKTKANEIIQEIKKILKRKPIPYKSKEAYGQINNLRRIFAEISLKDMKPDLVIMDEFQRFRPLIDEAKTENKTETSMLIKKFFGNKETKILLLSATPYIPYSTLDDLRKNNGISESYKDFFSIIEFLHSEGKDKKKYEQFKKAWNPYSEILSQLKEKNPINFKNLELTKQDAETALSKVMCRTERFNTEIIDDKAEDIAIEKGDIFSYCDMQKIMDESYKRDVKHKDFAYTYNTPIDYIKSTPFVLSFANDYKIKKHLLESSFKKSKTALLNLKYIPKRAYLHKYILNYNTVNGYKELENNNARLNYLKTKLFDESHSDSLLWVPASNPYYKDTDSVFEQNMDFSKVIIFSSWAMVPRMLATLLSYEAERLTHNKLMPKTYSSEKKSKYGLKKDRYASDVIQFVSKKFAGLYKPENKKKKLYGQPLYKVIKEVKKGVIRLLNEEFSSVNLKKKGPFTAKDALQILQKIEDGAKNESLSIPPKAIEILAKIAIASPGSCFLRIFKNKELANESAKKMVELFSHRESSSVIYKLYGISTKKQEDNYYEYVLDYCVKGNLQSVLDEYAFMIGKEGEELKKEFEVGLSGGQAQLEVDTYKSKNIKPLNMRTHYALSYTNKKQDDEAENRNINIQKVFNSPFRPFVLASTSIGQEGLDFHKYARKIMHWNLPSNPVELEQREGRVNRYLNLSIRRNVAHMYAKKYGKLRDWETMFEQIEKDYSQKDGGMIPYWYLSSKMLQNMENKHIPVEKIERIFAMYPLSSDVSKYEHVKKVLTLYRLTMGQPNQEELLNELDGKLNEKQIKELLIQLSPFMKEQKN